VLKAAPRIKTKSKFAGDPDGYPVILLHKLRHVLCGCLPLFYNTFMSIGQIPDAWKKAVVTPVYKKGSSSDPANYRPISQTSIFCKLIGESDCRSRTQRLSFVERGYYQAPTL